jgi:hypothetical protein
MRERERANVSEGYKGDGCDTNNSSSDMLQLARPSQGVTLE